jgi:hypothetical protein
VGALPPSHRGAAAVAVARCRSSAPGAGDDAHLGLLACCLLPGGLQGALWRAAGEAAGELLVRCRPSPAPPVPEGLCRWPLALGSCSSRLRSCRLG